MKIKLKMKIHNIFKCENINNIFLSFPVILGTIFIYFKFNIFFSKIVFLHHILMKRLKSK